ncbi:urease subunit beta [Tissierella sp.]|uniref:urease subunit beta n=1 Tax=Tissierella sp. TaxID=41274 RepID=UPI0028545DA5|nr:urease subunit beta [Tissierella sp.]MDR7855239.1 urease subunit beta [Tissierella sp.]
MIPGEVIVKDVDITLNKHKRTIKIKVSNHGDRAIQVGSHYHFFEVNKQLKFDREKSFGMRLDIPAGTAVRFEPGEEKEVDLVEIGGNKVIVGFNNLTNARINKHNLENSLERAKAKNFIE